RANELLDGDAGVATGARQKAAGAQAGAPAGHLVMTGIARLIPICLNRRLRRQVVRYVDGALDPAGMGRVRRHLESCAGCRAEAESLRFAAAIVSRLVLPDAPPAGRPRWSPPAQARATPARRPALWKILVPAAAAVVVVIITILLVH